MLENLRPEETGAIMAITMAILRIVYDAKERRFVRILIEALLCGGLSLTASSAISALGLDPNWSVFAGGFIGYFGPLIVRAIVMRIIKNKTK